MLTLAWPLVRSAAIIAPSHSRPLPAASRRPFETRIGALHDVGYNLMC